MFLGAGASFQFSALILDAEKTRDTLRWRRIRISTYYLRDSVLVDSRYSCHPVHATLTFRRWRAPQPATNKCKDHSSNLESLENYRIIELTPHLWSAPSPAPAPAAGPGPSICLAEVLLQAQLSPARNCQCLNQNNLVEDP